MAWSNYYVKKTGLIKNNFYGDDVVEIFNKDDTITELHLVNWTYKLQRKSQIECVQILNIIVKEHDSSQWLTLEEKLGRLELQKLNAKLDTRKFEKLDKFFEESLPVQQFNKNTCKFHKVTIVGDLRICRECNSINCLSCQKKLFRSTLNRHLELNFEDSLYYCKFINRKEK